MSGYPCRMRFRRLGAAWQPWFEFRLGVRRQEPKCRPDCRLGDEPGVVSVIRTRMLYALEA